MMLTNVWIAWLVSAVMAVAPPSSDPAGSVAATGVGYPPARMPQPQARLMARRAAEVGAVRNLYREINPTNPIQRVPFRYVSSVTRPDGSVVVRVSTVPRRR